MVSISSLWDTNNEIFWSKNIKQILSFTGEGVLKDKNQTSIEFNEFLNKIPSKLLGKYANECLSDKFEGSGYVLQDIVNQIGARLGFEIQYGRYRGVKNTIGFDGIWASKNQYNILVEVKTTDVYRINLNTIVNYRNRLIEQNNFTHKNSSILIIVGRSDTGDLECQILGSRHSWDVSLISVGALLNLLFLKEDKDDARTTDQINFIFRPSAYARLDKLVDLITPTANNLEPSQNNLYAKNGNAIVPNDLSHKNLTTPIDFYDVCIHRINSYLNVNLIKKTKLSYVSTDNSAGIILTLSKSYAMSIGNEKFWFSLYPHHIDFLKKFPNSYVAFGCGLNLNLYLINYERIKDILPYMTTSTKSKTYWHFIIYNKTGNFTLRVPKREKSIDLISYKII